MAHRPPSDFLWKLSTDATRMEEGAWKRYERMRSWMYQLACSRDILLEHENVFDEADILRGLHANLAFLRIERLITLIHVRLLKAEMTHHPCEKIAQLHASSFCFLNADKCIRELERLYTEAETASIARLKRTAPP